MSVSVLIPWRSGCDWREAALRWVIAHYRATCPDWQIVTGECAPGPFNRSEAILDAAARADEDMFVIADGDVWCNPTEMVIAIDHAEQSGWAIPHRLIHRLSPDSTLKVLGGVKWRGLPLSFDNPQDRRPYEGFEAGTLLVMPRATLELVPPDVRFVGWGQEDQAWAAALRTLVGRPWRGTADLVHLWHPAQPRQTRAVGSSDSFSLWREYAMARNRPARMRALVDAGRDHARAARGH